MVFCRNRVIDAFSKLLIHFTAHLITLLQHAVLECTLCKLLFLVTCLVLRDRSTDNSGSDCTIDAFCVNFLDQWQFFFVSGFSALASFFHQVAMNDQGFNRC